MARFTQQQADPPLVQGVRGTPESEVDVPTNCGALALKWGERLQQVLGRTLTPHDVAVLAAETSVDIAQRQGLRRLAVDDVLRDAGACAAPAPPLPPLLHTHPYHGTQPTTDTRDSAWSQRGGLALALTLGPALALATRASPNPNRAAPVRAPLTQTNHSCTAASLTLTLTRRRTLLSPRPGARGG